MVQQNKKKHQKFNSKRAQKRKGGKISLTGPAAKDGGKKSAPPSSKTQRDQRAAHVRENRRHAGMEAARLAALQPRSVVVVPINELADPGLVAQQISTSQLPISSGEIGYSAYASSLKAPPTRVSYVCSTWPEAVKLEAIRTADIVVFAVGVGDPSLPELAVDVPAEALDTASTAARSHVTGMTGLSGGTLSALVGVDEPSRVMLDAVCFSGVPTVVGVVQGTRRVPQATVRRRILRAHIRFFNSVFSGMNIKVFTADFGTAVEGDGAVGGPSRAIGGGVATRGGQRKGAGAMAEDDSEGESGGEKYVSPFRIDESGAGSGGAGVGALRHHLLHVKVEVPKWRASRPAVHVDGLVWQKARGPVPAELLSGVAAQGVGDVGEGAVADVGCLTVRGVVKGTGGLAAGSLVHLPGIGTYRAARVSTVHLTSAGAAVGGRTRPAGEDAEVVIRSDLSVRETAAELCGWVPTVEEEVRALGGEKGPSVGTDGGLGVAFSGWPHPPSFRVRSVAEDCDGDEDVVPVVTVGDEDPEGAGSQDGLTDEDEDAPEMDGKSVRDAPVRRLRGGAASVASRRTGRGVGGDMGEGDDAFASSIGTKVMLEDSVRSHELRAPYGFSAGQAMALVKRGLLDPRTGQLHPSLKKDMEFGRLGGKVADELEGVGGGSSGSDADNESSGDEGPSDRALSPERGEGAQGGRAAPRFEGGLAECAELVGGLTAKAPRDEVAAAQDDADYPDEEEVHADGISARQRFLRWFPLASWGNTPIDPTADLPVDYSRIAQPQGWRQIQAAAVDEVNDAGAVRAVSETEGGLSAPVPSRAVRMSTGGAPTNAPGAVAGNVAIVTLVGVPRAAVDAYLQSPYAQTAAGHGAAAAAPSLALTSAGPVGAAGGAAARPQGFDDAVRWIGGVPLVAYGLFRYEQLMTVVHFAFRRHDEYEDPIKSKTPLQVTMGFRTFAAKVLWSDGDATSTLRVPAQLRRAKLHRWLQPHHSMAIATCYAPVTFPPCVVTVHRGDTLVGGGSMLPDGASVDPDRMVIKKTVLTGRIFRCHKSKAKVRHMFYNKQDVEWAKPVELYTKNGLRGHITASLGTHGHFKARFNGPIVQDDTVCLPLYKRVFPSWTTVAVSPLHGAQLPGMYVPASAAPAPHLAADREAEVEDMPPAPPLEM